MSVCRAVFKVAQTLTFLKMLTVTCSRLTLSFLPGKIPILFSVTRHSEYLTDSVLAHETQVEVSWVLLMVFLK